MGDNYLLFSNNARSMVSAVIFAYFGAIVITHAVLAIPGLLRGGMQGEGTVLSNKYR